MKNNIACDNDRKRITAIEYQHIESGQWRLRLRRFNGDIASDLIVEASHSDEVYLIGRAMRDESNRVLSEISSVKM
jgi:hypothetical protein